MEAQSLILALNETRKTLLASRLLVVRPSDKQATAPAVSILPGDGVWIDDCAHLERPPASVPLDLLFLDTGHRVVAAVSLRPRSACPRVEEAAGVLQLAPGTIELSQTQKGDQVVLEPIVPRAVGDGVAERASRS